MLRVSHIPDRNHHLHWRRQRPHIQIPETQQSNSGLATETKGEVKWQPHL
jgi:hypothetical protein